MLAGLVIPVVDLALMDGVLLILILLFLPVVIMVVISLALLLHILVLAILLVLRAGHANHPALWTQTSSICTCGCGPFMKIGSTTYVSTTQGFFITQFNTFKQDNNISATMGSTTDIIQLQDQVLLIFVEWVTLVWIFLLVKILVPEYFLMR